MRLDLSEILREVGRSVDYEIHEGPIVDEDIECVSPIDGRLTFANTGGTLLVNGSATTRVALPCSRCSEYFDEPLEFTVEEQFELSHHSSGPRSLPTVTVAEEDESPAAGKLFDGHLMDLTELLRQYILLAEPTQPLPPIVDGRCAHCHRTPEAVLQAGHAHESAEAGNPALACLGDLLKKRPE